MAQPDKCSDPEYKVKGFDKLSSSCRMKRVGELQKLLDNTKLFKGINRDETIIKVIL